MYVFLARIHVPYIVHAWKTIPQGGLPQELLVWVLAGWPRVWGYILLWYVNLVIMTGVWCLTRRHYIFYRRLYRWFPTPVVSVDGTTNRSYPTTAQRFLWGSNVGLSLVCGRQGGWGDQGNVKLLVDHRTYLGSINRRQLHVFCLELLSSSWQLAHDINVPYHSLAFIITYNVIACMDYCFSSWWYHYSLQELQRWWFSIGINVLCILDAIVTWTGSVSLWQTL